MPNYESPTDASGRRIGGMAQQSGTVAQLILASPRAIGTATTTAAAPIYVDDMHTVAGTVSAINVSSATALVSSILANRKSVGVYNNGGTTLYLAYSSVVNAANGWPIPAGGSWIRQIGTAIIPYGSPASGTVDVRVEQLA